MQVGDATEIIEHLAGARHRHRVDGEVAPCSVGAPIIGECHHCVPPIGFHVTAECCDLEALALHHPSDRAVLHARWARANTCSLQCLPDVLGRARRGQIDLGGGAASQSVAHRPADHTRLGERRQHGGECWLGQERRRRKAQSRRVRHVWFRAQARLSSVMAA